MKGTKELAIKNYNLAILDETWQHACAAAQEKIKKSMNIKHIVIRTSEFEFGGELEFDIHYGCELEFDVYHGCGAISESSITVDDTDPIKQIADCYGVDESKIFYWEDMPHDWK